MTHISWGAYVLLSLSLAAIALSVVQYLRSRNARYYVMRRKLLDRARITALLGVFVLAIGLLLLIVVPRLPFMQPMAPTPTATVTALPSPRATESPTPTPSVTPTRRPTATPPVIPTATPEPTLPLEDTPTLSPTLAADEPSIVLQAVSIERDDSARPVDPASELPCGQHPIYLFFRYAGMQPGTDVTFAWYGDGQLLEPCSESGSWQQIIEGRDWGQSGDAYLSCELADGWQPGQYAVQAFVEGERKSTITFTIVTQ